MNTIYFPGILDFGIKTEGFCFTIENQSLMRQVVKHEVDDEKRYRLIYELLYRIRKFFKLYEVTDDFRTRVSRLYDQGTATFP